MRSLFLPRTDERFDWRTISLATLTLIYFLFGHTHFLTLPLCRWETRRKIDLEAVICGTCTENRRHFRGRTHLEVVERVVMKKNFEEKITLVCCLPHEVYYVLRILLNNANHFLADSRFSNGRFRSKLSG